ncbi:murein transglycosylase A [Enterovibrio norvegicus FF-33]|uniref:peptidoglycan lytic exotransglycosylase n=1 Tax=Enterovibrio norvegicus FF-454 TaxID=1185651 RepID=A0A1E5CA52_9GAMM|nr:murein transglycosylase A [Enterovibrio norvegicus]OEE62404.1 murein transglycosylase A [Enterovibrio norvegicus FF-454]OEE68327.1 murein transglycosylase A [Enterovibrio norvegicus FF-33]OEE75078.1 murein transglycosylase A [Enterovibrio norvegicus FF-162]
MNRALCVVGISILLAACARPTDRGQQYIDGRFDEVLNPIESVASDQPKDYSLFPAQLEKVESLSPSLSKPNQPLYDSVKAWLNESGEPTALTDYGIQLEQMGGGDGFGNVMFTGYFSPVIEMRHQPDVLFRYPVYAMPTCGESCPTREEIYNGALEGLGLELGYSASLIDNFIMEVQGSGFIHFGDTDQLEYFAYGGKNGHPYVSIGKVLIERGEVSREKMSLKAIKDWVEANDEASVTELLNQNPSYVFFLPRAAAPVSGTAGIPLLAGASVAADREYLPMGSVLLAEVPQLDKEGNWNGQHVLKLLMALDTGGAVKKNHLDLYHGTGEDAGIKAGHHKHFGRVWKLTKPLTVESLSVKSQ